MRCVSFITNSTLYLTEADCEEGIILNIPKTVLEGNPINLCIRLESKKVTEPYENLDTSIPGHPNCQVGDCFECHNVSCAIYQGYEEMP